MISTAVPTSRVASPTIVATDTLVPEHPLDQSAVREALRDILPLPDRKREAALALFDNACVHRRYSVLPIEKLRERRSLTETTNIYKEEAIRLGRLVSQRCLDRAGLRAEEIDLIISVSCTGIMIPSLDAYLGNELAFRPDVRRLPVTELGCVGGAAAVSRAYDYLENRPDAHVLIVSVELPTLSFQREDTSLAQLVSTALFGDGAAAVVLSGHTGSRGGARILGARSHLFPHTIEALGFDLRDDGFHVLLAKELPGLLAGDLTRVVGELLQSCNVRREDLAAFVLHPGGKRILAAVQEVLGIDRNRVQPSWDVLRDYGNVSSAAVLFVLHAWLTRNRPDPGAYGLLGGFGPGFSTELCVLQWT